MKLQKIASLVLALIMIFSLGITAFADDENAGSITINGVALKDGNPVATYSIYRLLDLESYNTTAGAYSYKVNSDWTAFFATGDGKAYIAFDADGYAKWTAADDDETKANFAKLALAYAEANEISPVKTSANAGEFVVTETTGKFSDLPLGYYLVDTTMGALCGLTTTNPAASVNAKNGQPTITKTVQEDLSQAWGEKNSADIGQTVEYSVNIHVHPGAQNYILHDEMGDGLTFGTVKVGEQEVVRGEIKKVEHITSAGVTDIASKGTDYTVVTECEDDCDFEIVFSKDFCEHIEANDRIIVTYSAMLNKNAVIDGEGNKNTAWVSFGETHETAKSTVTTYTYGFDIVKTDGQNTLIDDAKFRIYDAAEGGTEVGVVLMDDGVTYRRARADETGVEIVVENGKVRVVGFDNGTYYLEETEAPDGYNKITARQKFIISDGNLDATFNGDIYSTGSGVHVVNKTGSMLPETGGMGTTIFYVVGGLLVGGAIVALVSKKRMSNK